MSLATATPLRYRLMLIRNDFWRYFAGKMPPRRREMRSFAASFTVLAAGHAAPPFPMLRRYRILYLRISLYSKSDYAH